MKNVLVACAVLFSFQAFADDDLKPAQEEAKEAFEKDLDKDLKAVNEKCGTKVGITVDWKNYDAAAIKKANINFPSFCREALIDPVSKMCDRAAYKKSIAKQLTALKCNVTGGTAKTKEQKSSEYTQSHMKFEKGVFSYTLQFDHSNLSDNGKAVLEKSFN